jgi:hypothetical protein
MNERRRYLAAVIALYLDQPDAPPTASRHDWSVAQDLYARRVSLDILHHAVRLANLRRSLRLGIPLPPIRSLAYYRAVIDDFTPEDLEPAYIQYVASGFTTYHAGHQQRALSNHQDRALPDRR